MLRGRRGGGLRASAQALGLAGQPPPRAPRRPTAEGHLASARLGRRRPSAHVPRTMVYRNALNLLYVTPSFQCTYSKPFHTRYPLFLTMHVYFCEGRIANNLTDYHNVVITLGVTS